MCFMDAEKAFDIVLRKMMEWARNKKSLPEETARLVMSLHHRANTKVRVVSKSSKELWVQVSVHSRICVVTTAYCNCSKRNRVEYIL